MSVDAPIVAVLGPLPPALTGAAACTGVFVERLSSSGAIVQVYPLQDGNGSILSRIVSRIGSLIRRTHGLIFRKPDTVYVSLEGNAGKLFSLPIILLCRIMGLPVFLHHHAYSYIRKRDFVVGTITYIAPRLNHIFQCKRMAEEFIKLYDCKTASVLTLTNAFVVSTNIVSLERPTHPHVNLGFMSGSHPVEKGLLRALEVACKVAENGSATFHIAGPLAPDISAQLRQISASSGLNVKEWGLMRGDKSIFFRTIDFLLFPSTYINETQGIVNLEALSCGTPVIAIDQCCVSSTILPHGGYIFEDADTFVEKSPTFILKALGDEAGYAELRVKAVEQFRLQASISSQEVDRLISDIISYAKANPRHAAAR